MIKKAPLSFGIALFLIIVIVSVTVNYIYHQRMEAKDDLLASYREKLGLSPNAGTGPDLTVSENAITPTHSIHHVQGGLIKNITVPPGFSSGVIYLIPDDIFTTDTTGNIRNSFAASPGQVVLASYDGKKWGLLHSPFTENESTVSTARRVKAKEFETTGTGSGSIELQEIISGHKIIWSVGERPPTGPCVTGSLYLRSSGGAGSTLYVCEASTWVAK